MGAIFFKAKGNDNFFKMLMSMKRIIYVLLLIMDVMNENNFEDYLSIQIYYLFISDVILEP